MAVLYKYIGSVDNFGAYGDTFVAQRQSRFEIENGNKIQRYRHMRLFLRSLMPYGKTFTSANPNWLLFLEYMKTIPQEAKDFYSSFVSGTENEWYSELFTDCRQCKKKYEKYTTPDVPFELRITTIQTIPYKIYQLYIGGGFQNPYDAANIEYFDLCARVLPIPAEYKKLYLIETIKANPVITPPPPEWSISQVLFDVHCPDFPGILEWICVARNFKPNNSQLINIQYTNCP